MHLVMTKAELAKALRDFASQPDDALEIVKGSTLTLTTVDSEWAALIDLRHYQMTIPITVEG